MKIASKKKPKFATWALVAICLVSIFAVAGAGYVAWHAREIGNNFTLSRVQKEMFPEVNEASLTDRQRNIVQIVRKEYAAQPSGTKYAGGAQEPWCADFVSWVFNEAGAPFKNPNSGSWRIPGTLTLREYFVSKGVFHIYGDGYTPKTGDVVLYDGNGPHGQHTNIVMKYEDGKLYTVGGNEAGKIHAQVWQLNEDLKIVGFADGEKL